jgi:calcineurin-like phosphoesterase family protein
MKVKLLSSFPKQSYTFNNVWFSSDLHLNHEAVITFGRKFIDVSQMNNHIINKINELVKQDDLLVLLGDTIMGEKDYIQFLNSINCDNVILLVGNHCNRGKLQSALLDCDKLLYVGDYLELNIERQIICCSHFPMFNWNYQDDGAFHLHGHLHADENVIVKQIHEYKSMDVGIDNYYKVFGEYSLFCLEQVKQLLKDKLIIGRHE